jgi:uncharacterized membrane protein/nitrite reductase/ring-hydroxylating ferredoxin subunit
MFKDFLEGKPLRHPIHPMLVHFPIGLFVLSFIFDLVSFFLPGTPFLLRDSFYAMLLGVVVALLAAIPGLVDYSDIRRDHPGKRTATIHMVLNLAAVAIYAFNFWLRFPPRFGSSIGLLPLFLSVVGISLISISGYLGGKLIYDEGIAVGRHKRDTSTPQKTLRLSGKTATAEDKTIFVAVPNAKRLAHGETLRVEIDDKVLMIVRIEDEFYAVQEFCTHRFGPLSEGSFEGYNVQCPWHNSCFDVRTGKVTNGPAKIDLKTFKMEVRNGEICVGLARDSKSNDSKT